EDGIRDLIVTGVQTCALPISTGPYYVLVRHADRERVQALNLPVQILTFPEFGQPLLDYLQGLAKIVTSTEPSVVTHEVVPPDSRSEERRVGKESRSRRERCDG